MSQQQEYFKQYQFVSTTKGFDENGTREGLPWTKDDKSNNSEVLYKYTLGQWNPDNGVVYAHKPSRGPGRHSLSNGNVPSYCRGTILCVPSKYKEFLAIAIKEVTVAPVPKEKPSKSSKKKLRSAGRKGQRGLENRERERIRKDTNRIRREAATEGMVFSRHQPYIFEDDVAD